MSPKEGAREPLTIHGPAVPAPFVAPENAVAESVGVHVPEMPARPLCRRRPIGAEGQRGHVHVCHIEGVGAEDGQRYERLAKRIGTDDFDFLE